VSGLHAGGTGVASTTVLLCEGVNCSAVEYGLELLALYEAIVIP
jgi:hypothetical protein